MSTSVRISLRSALRGREAGTQKFFLVLFTSSPWHIRPFGWLPGRDVVSPRRGRTRRRGSAQNPVEPFAHIANFAQRNSDLDLILLARPPASRFVLGLLMHIRDRIDPLEGLHLGTILRYYTHLGTIHEQS